jgi:hypothetical protein
MKVLGRQLNWGVMKARLLFIIHAQLMTIPNMTQHNTCSTMLINQSSYLSPRYYLNSVDVALRARHSPLRTGNVSTLLTLPCARVTCLALYSMEDLAPHAHLQPSPLNSHFAFIHHLILQESK